jgi:hypothetical protein
MRKARSDWHHDDCTKPPASERFVLSLAFACIGIGNRTSGSRR